MDDTTDLVHLLQQLMALAEFNPLREAKPNTLNLLKKLLQTHSREPALIEALKAAQAAEEKALSQLRVATASRDDVWFWEPGGAEGNDVASLSCPVVMSADTLREILSQVEDTPVAYLPYCLAMHPNLALCCELTQGHEGHCQMSRKAWR